MIGNMIELTEALLTRAKQSAEVEDAARLTRHALLSRRKHCHPLSLLRYHAERAAAELARRRGNMAEARECDRHVLSYLEMALSHVPWHPALSHQRCRLADVEGALGNQAQGLSEIGRAMAALMLTHGPEHPLTQRAEETQQELLIVVEQRRRADVVRKEAEGRALDRHFGL